MPKPILTEKVGLWPMFKFGFIIGLMSPLILGGIFLCSLFVLLPGMWLGIPVGIFLMWLGTRWPLWYLKQLFPSMRQATDRHGNT